MLYKFILSFAPVNEILDCDHSIQRYHSVLYTFCCAVQGGFKVSSVTLKWEVYSALLSCDSVVIGFKFMSTSGSSNQLKLV